jgi:hypothetical protein
MRLSSMRRRRRNWPRPAAWLGIIALGLNALVPIHLAFDLADTLAPAHHAPAAPAELDRQILAFLCGHEADSDHHGKPGGHHDCPVCAAAATLAALALPTVAALAGPTATAVRPAAPPVVAASPAILAAAYRSRAPPSA